MPGQSGDEGADAVAVEGPNADWVAERAAAQGVEPSAFLEGLLASLRAADADDEFESPASRDDLDAVTERVAALEDDLDGKIADVRDRVIQVKREADDKAPADHGHDDLEAAVERSADRTETALQAVDGIESTIEDVRTRLDAGFENYEEILTYLVDRTDDLSANTETLGRALVALRRTTGTLAAHAQRRERVDRLKRVANREGVAAGKCDACGASVRVALLTEPACPFCGAALADVRPKRGFFGSATLVTGAEPALEEASEDLAAAQGGGDVDDEALASVVDPAEEPGDTPDPSGWREAVDSVVNVEEDSGEDDD